MQNLKGKRALVTGAASGIGRAIALALAGEGTHVYLLDLNQRGAEKVAELARGQGVEAVAARCDVTKPEQISASIREMLGRWSAIDILVNNVGVAYYGPTENMTGQQWDWLLGVNLHAPIQFTRELLPTLLARPEGHILNVCSIAGLVAGGRSTAYQVSKFGLVGFTEALRSEYVRKGVGATALCPGPVQTNLYRAAISGRTDRPVPEPPAWICASVETVARKAIRGIKKNQAIVLVSPLAYVLAYAKRLVPGLIDWANCQGGRRRRKKLQAAMRVQAEVLPCLAAEIARPAPAVEMSPTRGTALLSRPPDGSGEPSYLNSSHLRLVVPDDHAPGGELVQFVSHGTPCEGLLLRPADANDSTPLVLMAHGFGAEKDFGLMPFAERFMARGMAVMMFDYRHFGASGGEPRGLISCRKQWQDWQAALDFARRLDGIDSARIALWGTSFSGGHVIRCAADNPDVAAVVSQMPMLDVPGSLGKQSVTYLAKAIGHGLWDLAKAAFGRAPHRVPVVGAELAFAVMNKLGCDSGYRRLVADEAAWDNSCPARILLTSLIHRPIQHATKVRCPTLFVAAEQDQLIRAATIRKAAARMADATIMSVAGDHFAPYFDETFEAVVRRESNFLVRCLVDAQPLPMTHRAFNWPRQLTLRAA